ncbi:MFS transporter [Brevibacterium sp. 5221]|uniref:MFS transporter n=1 Tax=Brevibacterium rongguiense TaxID=2695267 RepID=A0A6N9H6N5_9MICO|nr:MULTISPECIES: MFS transporter [Brevibacterium]MYM19613.1 MFS transporter [Brevibacterium rongguiense]WAL41144.1 MFS transporter [Brevibacterium sp. BRM-1]
MSVSSSPARGSSAQAGAARPPAASPESALKRHRGLLVSGIIGSSIEWYDFFLYGTAAALIFPHVFFPESSALTGTLLSFSTFWAGFIARPIGGIIAGHYGDKIGRKPMVVISLLGMAVSTFAIGCLPGAHTVGAIAPVLLVLCRFIQGIACGGQWGGLALLMTESAGPKHRAFAGSFMQTGVPAGALLGNLIFVGTSVLAGEEAFAAWAWRVPFWFTAVLLPVVLYIQLKVEDSPEFKQLEAEVSDELPKVVQAPLVEAVRSHWKTILLAAGVLASTNCIFYISISGILSYGSTHLGMKRDEMMIATMASCAVGILTTFLWAKIADAYGRRPIIIIGGVGIALWVPFYFMLVNTGSVLLLGVAVCVSSVFQCMVYAPLAAYFGELFPPNIRFSGASLAYQLAAITISGGTPFLMTWLIATTGGTNGVVGMVIVTAVITVGCTLALKETNPRAIREDPHAVPGTNLYPDVLAR